MTMMNSACRATSRGFANTWAPVSVSAVGGVPWWLERNNWWPALTRFCAMGRPMMPVPINPMLAMGKSSCFCCCFKQMGDCFCRRRLAGEGVFISAARLEAAFAGKPAPTGITCVQVNGG
ncbi:hypothetical protein D3C87_1394680 [compost metagenome]